MTQQHNGEGLIARINRYLRVKPKVPDCYEAGGFMFCWCGQCKPKDYELPEDFKKALIIKVVETYQPIKVKEDYEYIHKRNKTP